MKKGNKLNQFSPQISTSYNYIDQLFPGKGKK